LTSNSRNNAILGKRIKRKHSHFCSLGTSDRISVTDFSGNSSSQKNKKMRHLLLLFFVIKTCHCLTAVQLYATPIVGGTGSWYTGGANSVGFCGYPAPLEIPPTSGMGFVKLTVAMTNGIFQNGLACGTKDSSSNRQQKF
jgi:hypothetical protein